MSYARFGRGSDVYIIGTTLGDKEVFMCCGCALVRCEWHEEANQPFGGHLRPINPEETTSPTHASRADMLQHLTRHRQAGHDVPDRCLQLLREETEWGQP